MTDKIKISVTMLVLLCAPLSIAEFDHSLWQELLQQHVKQFEVSRVTQLDFEAMQKTNLSFSLICAPWLLFLESHLTVGPMTINWHS